MRRRRLAAGAAVARTVVVAVLAAEVLGGCSLSLESLPAPAGVSGPTYRISATFTDVQTLAVGAKVKLGGAVIGDVTKISTKDYQAHVQLAIGTHYRLGVGSTFEVRFTTPLGEDYISVSSPGLAHGALPDGAQVDVRHTQAAPGIEDTFAALSTLLNGGGLNNIQTIAAELDTALNGRTGAVRDGLVQLDRLVATLDANKSSIDATLDNLQRMAGIINQSSGLVTEALQTLPGALQLLADDTGQLKVLLGKVGQLGGRVEQLLGNSQQYLLEQFAALRPTLDALRARESQLVPTFNSLIRFGRLIDGATPGDYLNVTGTIYLLLNAPVDSPAPGGTVRAGQSDAVTTLLTNGLPAGAR